MVAVEAVNHTVTTGRRTLQSEHPADLSICSHDNASSDREHLVITVVGHSRTPAAVRQDVGVAQRQACHRSALRFHELKPTRKL